MEKQYRWDVFISHASEDQENFVRPLAMILQQFGVDVWYSEFSLEIGNSISRSLDRGLAQSRYGLVVLSKNFIGKKWPEYELKGLVSREASDEVILPVLHGITIEDVKSFSLSLADKFSLNTVQSNAKDIAIQILRKVRPDIYNKQSRAQLEKVINGTALRELQSEFERVQQELEITKQELSQFQCPICKSPIIEQIMVPLDPNQDHWDIREAYECGFETLGGIAERICPNDPAFPMIDEYELIAQPFGGDGDYKWSCYAKPKTKSAKLLPLDTQFGPSEIEAIQKVHERYNTLCKNKKR